MSTREPKEAEARHKQGTVGGRMQRFIRPQAVDRLLGGFLLLVLVVVSALAISPGVFSQRIPYGDEHLGAIASGTLKANRDYDLPDEDSTRQMREDAVARVRAVYEHDTTAIDGIVYRIRDGFRFARSVQEEALSSTEEEGQAGRQKGAAQVQLDLARDEIERRLGARLEDDEFASLGRASFSQAVEDGVALLVTRVMREMVVGDREELTQHRSRGIAIRRTAGNRVVEEVLSEVEGIRDLAGVRAQIDAGVPELGHLPRELRGAAVNLARREIRSNLRHDAELTRKRREDAAAAVKPVAIQLKKGEKIVGDGERIEGRHLVIFRGMRLQSQGTDLAQIRFGGGLLTVLLIFTLMGFAREGFQRLRFSRKDLLFLALLLAGNLLLAEFWNEVAVMLRDRLPEIPGEAWAYAFPFAAGAMLLRMLVGAEAALLFSVAHAMMVGAASGSSFAAALAALLGSISAASRVAAARDRADLFRAGIRAGVVQLAVVVCLALFGGRIGSWDVLAGAVAAFLGGALLAPMLVLALLPVVEGIFGYLSGLKLLELASLNHPALKELIVQAPGTYHHSIIVGTLVEGAAEAIGANPLLAKVCAYYHDLGKGLNPLYFGENQRGVNLHDDLPPEESARVIVAHVAKGMEIARKHKLPKQVADAIPQHHGTRLVGFFYHKALKAEEAKEEPGFVDPELFRYAGPKPQSRECALVMMADAVEAASRSMVAPGKEKLRALVQKLIHGIFTDGQLDECPLTLQDLSRITDSFCHTLQGIYHSRPVYPPGATSVTPPAPQEGLVVSLRR